MNFKHKLLEGYTVSVMLEEEHLEDSGQLSLKQLSSIKSSSFLIWEGIRFPRDFKRSRVKLVALLLNLQFSIMTNYVCISRRKHKYRNYERIHFHKCWGRVYKWSVFICHRELTFMFLFNGRWISYSSNANLKKTLNSQQCFYKKFSASWSQRTQSHTTGTSFSELVLK